MKRHVALQGAETHCTVSDDRPFEQLRQDREQDKESAHHKWLVAWVVTFSFGLLLTIGAFFAGRLNPIPGPAYYAVGGALVALTFPLWNAHATAFKALLETQRRMHELARDIELAGRERR